MGGTTLEIIRAMHNVTGGACHLLVRVDDMGPLPLRCPPINVIKPPPHMNYDYGSVWHVPPKWMGPKHKFWMNNATFFTIVHNPYAQTVSAKSYGVQ